MPKTSKSTRAVKDSSNHGIKIQAQATGSANIQNQSLPIPRTGPQWLTTSHNRPTSDGDANTSSSQNTSTHQDANGQGMATRTPMQRWESETLQEGPYSAVYSYVPRCDEDTHAQSSNKNVAEHWSTDGNCES